MSRPRKITTEVEVPRTRSEAMSVLAKAYQMAGFSARQAAIEVARLMKKLDARDRKAA